MGWAKYREDIVSRWNNDNFRPQPDAVLIQAQRESVHREERQVSKLREFTMSSARPLPVIVLADTSGSMGENGKIDALNAAISDMITSFAEEDDARAEIYVCVVTFGGQSALIHSPLRPARENKSAPMLAKGKTPMGGAFELARAMIEDPTTVPSRAYRPALVLISDGAATDDWFPPLDALLKSERASKASRFALAIGADAHHETLNAFLADEHSRVFEAHEARGIKNFFRWVTMSVTTRSRSTNPNSVIRVEPTDLDEFDF